MTNLQPLGPRVLVKRIEDKKMTSGLIEVVQYTEEPSNVSVVLAHGKLTQGGLSVGDTVITKPFSGAPLEVTLNDVAIEAHMLMESDVLAVLEEGDPS